MAQSRAFVFVTRSIFVFVVFVCFVV